MRLSSTRRHRAAPWLFVVAVAAILGVPRGASAIERQHHVGLGPNLALLSVADKSTLSVGAGLTLHYAYGLTDSFNLMVEAGSAVVALDEKVDTPTTPFTRPATVDHAAVGVGYVIDILRWVPYVSVMPAAYRLAGGTLLEDLLLPGVSAGGGLDYELTRSWAIGVAVRQHMMLTKLSAYPSFTTAALRLEYIWGY